MTEPPPATPRFYGRRKGRPLHVRKSRLMAEFLPQVDIALPPPGNTLDPSSLFSHRPREIWLEVGFGGGEHLAEQAKRHPDIGLIGCEPFRNGIASLLDHVERERIGNVRVFPEDARLLMDALPDRSITRCYVLFADPWPKARHAERRFINAGSINELARILQPSGQLCLATDHPVLADWMIGQLSANPNFQRLYCSNQPPAGWVSTRYETKALAAQRPILYSLYMPGS